MVDKCTISLIHVDTKSHTTTLCVPNFGDVDETVMNDTLKDVNELIEYSITQIPFKVCIAIEARDRVESLDSPLHKHNFMFYVSLHMVS